MAYTPTTWNTGDTINATKLNKIEQGIANAGSGALIVEMGYTDGVLKLNKTVQELYEATQAGIPVYLIYQYGDWELSFASDNSLCMMYAVYKYSTNMYRVSFIRMVGYHQGNNNGYLPSLGVVHFGASTTAGYPQYLEQETL